MNIDDLPDEMMREILCRLPCYRTALRCKAVCKRWFSLISEPLFITQGFLTHCGINKKEPSFTLLLTMIMWDYNCATAMLAPPCSQRTTTLQSSILSLQFLPYNSDPVATFRDLILTSGVHPLTGLGVFYICNPLTKQWIVLPPSTVVPQKPVFWAVLTYLDERNFRVVVAYSYPKKKASFLIINLLIYISETCEWRNIDVKLQLNPYAYYGLRYFRGIMCKSMVCIQVGNVFGVLNPFDVTDTFCGTLTAIDLSLPPQAWNLLVCDEKLVACEVANLSLSSDSNNRNLMLTRRWCSWKLDLIKRLENDEQVVHQWELISQLDEHSSVEGSLLVTHDDSCKSGGCDHSYDLKVVGVHPTNDRLLYFEDVIKNHLLILFDTKSKTLEPLTTKLYPREIWTCYKLDIPSWPTPIPFP